MTLTASFFVSRVQQLYRSVLSGLKSGLPSVWAQALVLESVAALQDTYQARKFYDQATGSWLDLHASSVGRGRFLGEIDASLRRRVRMAGNTTLSSLRAELAAVWTEVGGAAVAPDLREAPLVFWGPKTTVNRDALDGEAIVCARGVSDVAAPVAVKCVASGRAPRLVLHFDVTGLDLSALLPTDWAKYNAALAAIESGKAAGARLDVWFDGAI